MGLKSPLQITPELFSTLTHGAAHCKAKVLCRVPCHPSPRHLQPCLTPVTPTKQKAFDSWLGRNTYRPLRIELETSDDFKKSCLGQKESLSAQDLIRKIKVKIRQHELSPGLKGPEVRDAGVRVGRGRGPISFTAANHACSLSHLEVLAQLLPPPGLGQAHP